MLTSATSVIDRRIPVTGVHTTYPFETGWACEAIFFVQTEGDHPDLTIQPQISPDGITWIDHHDPVSLPAADGACAVEIARFGSWLRLEIDGADERAPATLLIHLALKG